MSDVVSNLKSLGATKLAILAAIFAGIIAATFISLSTVLAPTYTALYSELSPASASRIVSSLEQGGFRVKLSSDGSVVSVPQEDMARARMVLADTGLPTDGMPGWELFDGSNGMGMNTFLQKVTRLRALEGELSRSIQTIEGIEAARVHLVLPEREAFSRHRPDPTASVIIRSGRGNAIGRRQGLAIRALVASAVPELAAQNVTVLSASGETILGPEGDNPAEAGLMSRKSEIEDRMARKINDILSARVGVGNARVEVNVDLSTTRQVTRSEQFDPNGQVVRSTETREESSRDQSAASGAVGVDSNLPAPFGDAGGAAGGSTETESINEVVNYEIANTLTETVSEPGAILRVSVAALVDGAYETDANGDVVFTPRDAAELERLGELIRAAIGFDAERGDTVSVDSLQFVDITTEAGAPAASPLMTTLSGVIPSVIRGLLALVLIGIVVTMGLRPAVRMLLEYNSDETDTPDPLSGSVPEAQQLAPPAGTSDVRSGVVLSPGEMPTGETVRIASVEGGVNRQKVDAIGSLVDQRRDDALQAMQGLLKSEPVR